MLRTGLALFLIAALSACGGVGPTTRATAPGTAWPSLMPSRPVTRPELPDAFPVLPGASELALPTDDPGLIAQWRTDRVGAVAYDFYSAALPAAGFHVEGRYPGDTVAIIRFIGPTGGLWQVVIQGLDARMAQIEVRLDRP